ncbi:MAG: leucine-rich repeat protein [Eubacterium coprostanoligenes]|uniref:leucine-rich repeat protein n=1 Tax=Eubacterium coprostanoligenes TaxID=290054 RepID=UPI002408F703|nr:leucine-rich repeat protein [Eubacterium coprostanoligenes]MDD6665344.1 leucine-rich repeat protein [Eubacterium coprostanoligenes]
MKNKRLICLITAVALIISGVLSISLTAVAGTVSFNYEPESATLTVKGSGDILDYKENDLKSRPWNVYRDETKHIVISDGITSVGSYSFAQFKYTQTVELPSSVKSIGEASFAGCNKLLELTVPDSVETVGDYAFGFNDRMETPQGFVAHCSTKSAAQAYCFRNNIMFDSPMDSMSTTAHITKSDELQLWSFVPLTDGKLTFYSTGKKNTVGFLFDAENYVYSDNYGDLRRTALIYDDDWNGGGLNFKFSYNLKAGKRYYLGARFRLARDYDGSTLTENGKFDVVAEFVCSQHKYELSSTVEPTCEEYGYNVYTCIVCGDSYKESISPLGHDFVPSNVDGSDVVLDCSRCGKTSREPFANVYHAELTDENRKFDVNSDGVINAKDYAILRK